MAKLTIVRGIPGSGKSTYARSLGCFHLEADMFFIQDGVYTYDAGRIQDAHEWCLWETSRQLVQFQIDVVVSNTFTRHWEMEPYISLCQRNSIPYTIEIMEGNYGSVHNVPAETLNRMRARFER